MMPDAVTVAIRRVEVASVTAIANARLLVAGIATDIRRSDVPWVSAQTRVDLAAIRSSLAAYDAALAALDAACAEFTRGDPAAEVV